MIIITKTYHKSGRNNERFHNFRGKHFHARSRLPLFPQQWFLVYQVKTPSVTDQTFLVNIWTNSECPNGAWNHRQICFLVTLLVNCLGKELIAYKIPFKYFIQVLSFVTLVHIAQTATKVGPNYTLHSQTNFKIFLPQPVRQNLMLRSMLQQITEGFEKKYEKTGNKTPVNQKIYHLNILHLHPAQTRKRTKKKLLNSHIKLLTYRHPIVRFLQKTRTWSRSKSL